ncbi:Synaptotagmin-2 [Balamuthia mandrillaris]
MTRTVEVKGVKCVRGLGVCISAATDANKKNKDRHEKEENIFCYELLVQVKKKQKRNKEEKEKEEKNKGKKKNKHNKKKSEEKSFFIFRSLSDTVTLSSSLKGEASETVKAAVNVLRDTKKLGSAEEEEKLNHVQAFLDALLEWPEAHQQPSFTAFFERTKEEKEHEVLTVEVFGGRDLKDADIGSKSDPYCKLVLYDNDLKGSAFKHRTYVIQNDLNPVWKHQKFSFLLPKGHEWKGASISCWDEDIGKDDFLGRVSVALDSLPFNEELKRWFPLHNTQKFKIKGSIYGELHLSFFYRTFKKESQKQRQQKTQISVPTNSTCTPQQRQERAHWQQLRETQTPKAGEIVLRYLYNPPVGRTYDGCLTVHVVEAKELQADDCDPYLVVKLGDTKQRCAHKKNETNPKFDKTFFFYIPPHKRHHDIEDDETDTLEVEVWDYDAFSSNDMIGGCEIDLWELELDGEWHDLRRVLFGLPPTEEGLSRKLGKDLAENGYRPNLPIVLVPGFGSSGLFVEEGAEDWLGARVWLSITRLTSEKLKMLGQQISGAITPRTQEKTTKQTPQSSSANIDQNEREEELSPSLLKIKKLLKKNEGLGYMCLDSKDLCSDPPGVKVRSLKGSRAVTYLDPGLITGNLSYVMGPLFRNLQELGYKENYDLYCAPYDWRVPPHYLEQRDQFFSQLKKRVTKMREQTGKPVVLLGHSMGNKTVHYFLNFVNAQAGGPEWIQQNIHTFVAVGAPWLGAPKVCRSMATGDALGLEAFMKPSEAVAFARSIGTSLFLMPVGEEHYHSKKHNAFIYWREENDQGQPKPVEFRQFLQEQAGAKEPWLCYDKYFMQNPLFGGPSWEEMRCLQAPPVPRLYSIYGVDLETEVRYFYTKRNGKLVFDTTAPKAEDWKGHTIKDGIICETPETKQGIIKKLTNASGHRSGDGTVPYASLAYCLTWKNAIPELRNEELVGVEHREILANRLFCLKLMEYIAVKEEENGDASSKGANDQRNPGQHPKRVCPDVQEDDEEVQATSD